MYQIGPETFRADPHDIDTQLMQWASTRFPLSVSHRFKWRQTLYEHGTQVGVREWSACQCSESHATIHVNYSVNSSGFVSILGIDYPPALDDEQLLAAIDDDIQRLGTCHVDVTSDTTKAFIQPTYETMAVLLQKEWEIVYRDALSILMQRNDPRFKERLSMRYLTLLCACLILMDSMSHTRVSLASLLGTLIHNAFGTSRSWFELSTLLPLPRGMMPAQPTPDLLSQLHTRSLCLGLFVHTDEQSTSCPIHPSVLLDFFWHACTEQTMHACHSLQDKLATVYTDSLYAQRTHANHTSGTIGRRKRSYISIVSGASLDEEAETNDDVSRTIKQPREVRHAPCIQAIIDAAHNGNHPKFNARSVISLYLYLTMSKEDAREHWYDLFAHDSEVPHNGTIEEFYAKSEYRNPFASWERKENVNPHSCEKVIKLGLCPFANSAQGAPDIEDCARPCIDQLRKFKPALSPRFILRSPVQFSQEAL